MNDLTWLEAALTAARPQAVAALLRYFRNLDMAEEAFQEASLRALQRWPVNGPPRDPAAWLIMVGRNFAVDEVRRAQRLEWGDEKLSSQADESEGDIGERLDTSQYRDDILRLLFVCCHPALPVTQQIALALRIVSGLSVKEVARAFLVGESAMEQRITRAKRHVAAAGVSFETPGAVERAERLGVVAMMIYLLFNEGYSSSGGNEHVRTTLCDEAIRLARLLSHLFPAEPEIMGLLALLLLQHARAGAARRRRRHRAARASGPLLVEPGNNRRRPGHGGQGDPASPSRPVSGAGRHRRAACARRERLRHGLE